MNLFSKVEYLSNHGTDHEIVSRFLIQIEDIAKYSFKDDKEYESRMEKLENKNLNDLIAFYDIYHSIINASEKYLNGINNREYFYKDSKGVVIHHRELELEIKRNVKNFFIEGKQLVSNLAKSKIIDDDLFCLNDLLNVKDSNFEKNVNSQLEKDEKKRYSPLFSIIRKSRKNFLQELGEIRADFEHNDFQIDSYRVEFIGDDIKIEAPQIRGKEVIASVAKYYRQLTDFCEILLVLYFGINAVTRVRLLGLYQNVDYDLKALKHQFILMPRVGDIQYQQIL